MFSELTKRIPVEEPNLKIGPLSFWVLGYNDMNQIGEGDSAYLKTPTLLETENFVVFSEKSNTALFEFKELLHGVIKMHDNIKDVQTVEFNFCEVNLSCR